MHFDWLVSSSTRVECLALPMDHLTTPTTSQFDSFSYSMLNLIGKSVTINSSASNSTSWYCRFTNFVTNLFQKEQLLSKPQNLNISISSGYYGYLEIYLTTCNKILLVSNLNFALKLIPDIWWSTPRDATHFSTSGRFKFLFRLFGDLHRDTQQPFSLPPKPPIML